MRLFTSCRYCGQRLNLSTTYLSRRNIPSPLKIRCPYCTGEDCYMPNEIWAEPNTGTPLAGAALGAVVGGLIGGPIGLILGGALGGAAGAGSEQQDMENVQRFNDEVI